MSEDKDMKARQKVLDIFFADGRLKQLPMKQAKRRIVLEHILAGFETDRRYSEKEINQQIEKSFDDYCTIRREMVELGMMHREKGIYWLDQATN